MTRPPRRNHSPAFKAKVAGRDTGGTVAAVRRTRHSDQAVERPALEGATGVFGDAAKAEPAVPTVDVKTLHAKIGELTLENDYLPGALGKAELMGGKK